MRDRLDNIYYNMRKRCTNPRHFAYSRYGGRGITICEAWAQNKSAFKEWAINNGYQENLTIDRIDNDKGYSPDNCRWVTRKENCNNRSNTHKVCAFGETHSLKEWSELLPVSYRTLTRRVKAGEPDGEHLLRPSHRKRVIEV